MTSAARYLDDGKYKEARNALAPIAYDPHNSGLAQAAKAMMEKIDAKQPDAALATARSQAASESGTSPR